MKTSRIISRLFALAAAVFVVSSGVSALQATRQLAQGVSLYQEIRSDPVPLVINAVFVDPANPDVRIRATLGCDVVLDDGPAKGRENLSRLTARKDAAAGINADFFPFTGDPLGICIIDGELVSEPPGNRVALAVTVDRRIFFDVPRVEAKLTLASGVSRQIDGINRGRETNQVVVYTPAFGAGTRTTHRGVEVVLKSDELPLRSGIPLACTVAEVRIDAVNTPIPPDGLVLSAGGPAAWFLKENLKPGDTLTIRFDVRSAAGFDWNAVEQAVGGGPWLLKSGAEFIDFKEEGFSASFSLTRHPRTAAGVTADGKLLLVTVDGRQTISGGMSLSELSKLMRRLGAVDAINLDGGGSTTLASRGILINSPSGGEERPVANALLVLAPEEAIEPLAGLSITGIGDEAISGQPAQLFLTWGQDAQLLTPDQLSRVVWGTTNGIGFVDQSGVFVPIKARKGTVSALYGGQLVSRSVTVVAGEPSKINLQLTDDPKDPASVQVKGTVFDVNSNRVPNREVRLIVLGGKVEPASVVTSPNGEFVALVVWDKSAVDRGIKAISGNAAAEVRPPAQKR